ncbi:MAG: hypothetical protein AAFZ06_01540 [Pseudomonadota bacterium]
MFKKMLRSAAIVTLSLMTISLTADAEDFPDPPMLEENRLCYVALISHLDTPETEDPRYPKSVVQTLLNQMHFTMAEYVFGPPAANADVSIARLRFAEAWFFDTADLAARRGDELRSLESRERVIDGCVDIIWRSVKYEIDRLMRDRNALMGLPAQPPETSRE